MTIAVDNDCTLREAIIAANAAPNSTPVSVDVVEFGDTYSIVLDEALPPVTEAVTISVNAGGIGSGTAVIGGPSYSCADPSVYALSLADSGAAGSTVRRLPISAVCGRAIESPLLAPPPDLRIGPRRADGTLPVSGSAPDGAVVEIFVAASGAGSFDREATALLGQVTASGGTFSFVPAPEVGPGTFVTATISSVLATSNFATRVTVPDDVVAPTLTSAAVVTPTRVRVDFSEAIAPATAAPGDFALTIAGRSIAAVATTVVGRSVYVDVAPLSAWRHGEAGVVATTGPGAVTDLAGNESAAPAEVRAYAAGADLEPPVISGMRIRPSKFCSRKGRGCRRTKARITFKLSEPARVMFRVQKFRKDARTLARARVTYDDGGSQSRGLTKSFNGKVLRRGLYALVATPRDHAGNGGQEVVKMFEIRTPRRR